MKLYELTGQYLQLEEMMEDSDIDPAILKDTMESLDGEFEEKLNNCGKVLKNYTAHLNAIEEEIKRLQAKKKTLSNKQENFKNYIKTSMQAVNKKSVKTLLFTFTVKDGVDSVVIDNEDAVPEKFREKVPDKINKDAIKADLKNGQKFTFAHLEKGQPSLQIR